MFPNAALPRLQKEEDNVDYRKTKSSFAILEEKGESTKTFLLVGRESFKEFLARFFGLVGSMKWSVSIFSTNGSTCITCLQSSFGLLGMPPPKSGI
mmetsp:Transcript_34191/g.88273  ORF Transcript_34191/g.88273 Transcript_34191/m.88273 type:complete len:96 (-) Transcript_34191:787-1074(-)